MDFSLPIYIDLQGYAVVLRNQAVLKDFHVAVLSRILVYILYPLGPFILTTVLFICPNFGVPDRVLK